MSVAAWVVYGIGIVLFPIVVGMFCGRDHKWDVFDDGIPLSIISIVWPVFFAAFLLFMAVVLALIGLCCVGAVLGYLWLGLVRIGSWVALALTSKSDAEVLEAEKTGKKAYGY